MFKSLEPMGPSTCKDKRKIIKQSNCQTAEPSNRKGLCPCKRQWWARTGRDVCGRAVSARDVPTIPSFMGKLDTGHEHGTLVARPPHWAMFWVCWHTQILVHTLGYSVSGEGGLDSLPLPRGGSASPVQKKSNEKHQKEAQELCLRTLFLKHWPNHTPKDSSSLAHGLKEKWWAPVVIPKLLSLWEETKNSRREGPMEKWSDFEEIHLARRGLNNWIVSNQS